MKRRAFKRALARRQWHLLPFHVTSAGARMFAALGPVPSCHYVLNADGEAVPAKTWAEWLAQMEGVKTRRVALDRFGNWSVSTVFLGLDHGFGGAPQLFETMIFAPDKASPFNYDCRRWATRAEAVAGHAETVEMIKAVLGKNENA